MVSSESLPSADKVMTTAASAIGTILFIKSVANDLVPYNFRNYLSNIFDTITSTLRIIIEESDALTPNQMFEAVNLYLGTKLSPSTHCIKVVKPPKDDELQINIGHQQQTVEYYEGVKYKWLSEFSVIRRGETDKSKVRRFELFVNKKFKDAALKVYLPYVLRKAKEIRETTKTLKLHTVDYSGTDYWSPVVLNHPATFETMAMEPDMKKELMEDLDRFVRRRDYYRRVGKAWKRGYLFYGPPGTGKSSLVAAMANYLKFDVYDMDLREVQCNSDLRRMLIGTKNRSILVIEDIDCNVGLQNREILAGIAEEDKITLSGMLNFIDGLWSSCGDERIIVFTTNHKERLDPALLRPGRIDVQLEMSYCTFSSFKVLATNYLKVEEHRLFSNIQELLTRTQATPAEVAGELMKNDDADTALLRLVKFLEHKEAKGNTM